ncbi:uncharacterized protein ACMZJ9_009977 [Mantella aurantiaca]
MEPPLSMNPTCKCLFEQLVILFHHHQCEECEETDTAIQYITLPLCHSMGTMLSHIKYCRAGMSCKIPSCPDSRVIVSHGRVCKVKDCPVVLSLGTKRMEWTQELLQQVDRCSFSPEIYDLEVGNARQLLFILSHIWTCMNLNEFNSLCTLPQCRTMKKLRDHSQTYLKNHVFSFHLQNIQMFVQIPNNLLLNNPRAPNTLNPSGLQDSSVRIRSSQTHNWQKKSRKSWGTWKRCDWHGIRRHAYRNLECKSRPAQQQQRRTRGNPSQVLSSL